MVVSGSTLEMELLVFDVHVHVCSLFVVERPSISFPHSLPHAVLNCVECLFEADGFDPEWLVPLSGSLSDLMEREQAVGRRAARSKACLVSGLVEVQRDCKVVDG